MLIIYADDIILYAIPSCWEHIYKEVIWPDTTISITYLIKSVFAAKLHSALTSLQVACMISFCCSSGYKFSLWRWFDTSYA